VARCPEVFASARSGAASVSTLLATVLLSATPEHAVSVGGLDPRASCARISHPPAAVYFPLADVRAEFLAASNARATWCECKDAARHPDAIVHARCFEAVGSNHQEGQKGSGWRVNVA
jgi:Domain of unknown function (DUF427)